MSGSLAEPDRPLPERLIRAAADAVAMSQCARHEEREYHWARADGVAAASAVLRELIKDSPEEIVMWLEHLAGVVEEGENI